ncbi:response regulator transcription factor [Sulfitobacter sp. 1A12157]|uniref:response regulator transcription factor n=1 Tax=Sulfitobacter sp. 1A12157 TaxID=3368594 RepID=UPI003745A84E
MSEEGIVYVVDDDAAVRESLVWLLGSVGLRAIPFASASAFLDRYEDNGCCCLVSDVRMPGMSGLELQKALNARGIELPLILMTAFGDVSTAVTAMKAGAVDFIEKPFNNQNMLDLINAALQADAARRKSKAAEVENAQLLARLTPQEHRVFERVAAGLSNREIGSEMDISIKTVEVHRARVMRKLEANSVAELVRFHLHNAPSGEGDGGGTGP